MRTDGLRAEGWTVRSRRLFRLIGGVIEMAFRQMGTATGRAYQGLALSTGKELPLSDLAATGIAISGCPAGPPTTMPKNAAREAHTN